MSNPFGYQGPVAPRRLIDRRDELFALQRAAGSNVAIRLAAPRRFGKTTLLLAHVEAMRQAGHRSVLVDFGRVATFSDAVVRLAAAYASLPADPGGAIAKWAGRLGVSIDAGLVSIAPAAELPATDAQGALRELLDLPTRLHAQDAGLTVVCFDEFQDLLVASDGLDGLFRSVIQFQGEAASYVYAGSEPSLMRALFADRERPFYGQARPLELPSLPVGETVADVAAAIAAEGLTPPPGAVPALLALTEGHPQRTMLVAHHLFEALEAGDAQPLRTAVDAALAEAADAIQASWEAQSRLEQVVLAALADGKAPTGSRLATDHRVPRSSLSNALARLVAAGQLVTRDGTGPPRLVDPLMGEWLRRRNRP